MSFCGSKNDNANANLNELKGKIDVSFSDTSNDFKMIDSDEELPF